MRSLSAANYARDRAGFSLVELAIVIGVFVTMLAGIWAIVRNVQESARVDQAAHQITSVVNGVRALYQGKAQISGAWDTLTNDLIARGAIPADMKRPGTSSPNLRADHPWGAAGGNDGGFRVAPAADNTSFYIYLYDLSERSCIAMAAKVASLTGATGLMGVAVNGNSLALPVKVSDAESQCNANNTNNVRYQFRLRRPNA